MERMSLNVVVLMGGPSGEHDISLKSGHGVTEALLRQGFRASPLVIPHDISVEAACDGARQVLAQRAWDVAFIALHGPFGEDGTIQTLCERLGVPYTGSGPEASRLGMDKLASKLRFESAGLLTPRWLTADPAHPLDRVAGLRFPVVVKPVGQGSSLGVSIVPDAAGLPEAMRTAGQYGQLVLIEEFVQGREVTVGVLDEAPLPVVEIRPREHFFDFAAKYTKGQTDYLVPAPLDAATTAAVQEAGRRAHEALGCRHLSRSDIIVSRYGPVVLEVNTIPGFTPTSLLPKAAAHAGISYDELCGRLVMLAWQQFHRVAA
jgi:D-alanine-D-alanine ligase